ncbi:MAG TPA: DPP IV N-terminal domain-containing protein, partial [Thermoanaerobaculia bacterium]|nr:DPP IV N-terminal domain-containing protein [Thermoanaerobaculia bacterium]
TRLLAVSELGEDAALDAYHWSPTGGALALESGGDLWLLRLDREPEAGRLTRLTETEPAEETPTFSPDGKKLAYVREANLYILELDSEPLGSGRGEGGVPRPPTGGEGSRVRGETRLTTDGEPGTTLNATTTWVYWEEIWNRDPTAFWWSPDSTRIAYYRFDETPVAEYTLLADYRPPYPEPRRQRYPKAGTTNPGVAIGVLEVATGQTVWLEAGGEEESYLARVHWRPDGATVAVERLNREQTALDLLFCDPRGGGCRVVLEERHPTWVNLGTETAFLPGDRLLWASERDGWRHLYLYAIPAGGGPLVLVRPLTAGAWAVAAVAQAGADALVTSAYGEGPLGAARRRLLRVPLDGSRVEELTGGSGGSGAPGAAAGGWHEALVAPGGRHLIHRWSGANDPGWQRLESIAGELVAELPSEPPAYDPAALPRWQLLELPAPEGDGLPAALLRPAGAEDAGAAGDPGSTEPHPVVMYHYGGPGSQVVVDRWDPRGRGLWHKLMAQRGFGVLMVDNRASVFFGKAGEDRVHRRFGEVNLAAQKAGVEYLAAQPWADAARIGLWGWSGGGSNTLYCLLKSPGTWRSGVAGAPVTDWRYYDTVWTERYLDHPEDNPDGYRDSSAVTWAGELRDRLLIVHGTADDNVHPQNTMALVQAWVEAGIPFEVAVYPGQTHGIRDAAARHFYEKMTEFFERTLAP